MWFKIYRFTWGHQNNSPFKNGWIMRETVQQTMSSTCSLHIYTTAITNKCSLCLCLGHNIWYNLKHACKCMSNRKTLNNHPLEIKNFKLDLKLENGSFKTAPPSCSTISSSSVFSKTNITQIEICVEENYLIGENKREKWIMNLNLLHKCKFL